MKKTVNESQLREIVKQIIRESLNEISPELAGYVGLRRMQQGKTAQGWEDWNTAVDKFNVENGSDNSAVFADPGWGKDFGERYPKELSASVLNYPGNSNTSHYFSMGKDGKVKHSSQFHQYGNPQKDNGGNSPVYGNHEYDYSREKNVRKASDMNQRMNTAVVNHNNGIKRKGNK